MQKKMTAVLILNYNNYEDTINCIKSIEQFNTSAIKYVVVDNGSTRDDVVVKLDTFFSDNFSEKYSKIHYESSKFYPKTLTNVTFIVSSKNDGYAVGNNKGLEFIYNDDEIENVLVINNDVLFVEDILPSMLEYLNRLPNSGIVSPLLYKKDFADIDYHCARLNQSNWGVILAYLFLCRDFFGIQTKIMNKQLILKNNKDLIKNEYLTIELPSGSCMLFDKNMMKSISGFDPNTFLYYEENILYKKIEKIGKCNYLIPSLKCIHLGASSTSKSSSSFVLRAGMRSMEYYLKNYANLSMIQKLVLKLAVGLFSLKIMLVSLFKG